jgi:hypothetical protein
VQDHVARGRLTEGLGVDRRSRALYPSSGM